IPLLGTYSVAVAWGVLGAEALVALLLIWPGTNRLGLWGAFGLMVAFTVYIGSMLLFAAKLPCHCGGAIEKLTWGQHLLFNCGFIALAAGLLLYHYKVNLKHKILTAMKAINSKIKKAAFGMMAAALTVGFSAFQWGNEAAEGVVWTRIADPFEETGPDSPEGSNQWVQGAQSGNCLEASRICTATFPEEYDPNDSTYNTNQMHASSVTLGFKEAP